jgi:hypothetical protein
MFYFSLLTQIINDLIEAQIIRKLALTVPPIRGSFLLGGGSYFYLVFSLSLPSVLEAIFSEILGSFVREATTLFEFGDLLHQRGYVFRVVI